MTQPLLSLCIPTNGISELVFPVLDSIFIQKDVPHDLYEVVVMDNGNNCSFKEKMIEYAGKYDNLRYKQTDAHEFLSEAECYKCAEGLFIKFINHRTKLLPGTLQYFIDFVKQNEKERSAVYFSNGVIKNINGIYEYLSFDEYVKGLSYWSSWSTGMGFWKDDFDKIPKDAQFNTLFPHTTILFNEKHKGKYIIDNTNLLYEIPISHANKGKYNLFYAFGVEYPGIIYDLYRNGVISAQTFIKVKNDNLGFIAELYRDFVIFKIVCSYDLSGREESLNVFYSLKTVKKLAKKTLLRGFAKKVYRKIFK